VMAWLAEHDGRPEARAAAVSSHGLHGARRGDSDEEQGRPPLRYVLPAGKLT
jgi:hypothetical protein